ncbi:hypothetical protein SUGI_0818780 [Cryptomeria japonica]|nr:hypothetical protein SUGI_0818780 [Cryptomeria japonica]
MAVQTKVARASYRETQVFQTLLGHLKKGTHHSFSIRAMAESASVNGVPQIDISINPRVASLKPITNNGNIRSCNCTCASRSSYYQTNSW